MKNVEMVFFDMDGCLVDSEYLYVQLWKQVFDQYQIPIGLEEINSWRGRSYLDIVEIINEHTHNFDFAMSLRDIRDRLFWEKLALDEVQLKPYALEILDDLDHKGIPYACVTSTFKVKAKRILEHFNLIDRFQFVLYGDQVKKTKPDPALYLEAITLSGINKEKILVFEDSYHGIVACNRADLDVVYVPDRNLIDQSGLKIFHTVSDFSEAMKIIAPMMK